MRLEECYNAFGGSYQEIKSRLGSDRLVERFARKFLNDTSYEKLQVALENKNYEEAFRAAHTLKGVCQNLSLQRLSVSSGELTELLRHYETVPVDEEACNRLWHTVSGDYSQVVDALRTLDE